MKNTLQKYEIYFNLQVFLPIKYQILTLLKLSSIPFKLY